MRYDSLISFVKEGSEVYNPVTGDYIASEPVSIEKWANVSDLGEEKKVLVVGDLSKKAKIIRLDGVFKEAFDWIEYDGTKYVVKLPKFHRRETVFYVGEA